MRLKLPIGAGAETRLTLASLADGTLDSKVLSSQIVIGSRIGRIGFGHLGPIFGGGGHVGAILDPAEIIQPHGADHSRHFMA